MSARCVAVVALLAVAAPVVVTCPPAAARQLGADQAPPDAPSRIEMVGEDETGQPLEVTGAVFDAAGRPLSGAGIYVYHTAADGSYGPRGSAEPRLRGFLRTDSRGRYLIRTIKPTSYPGSRIPAHIHIHVAPPGGGADQIGEILFADDPYLTDRMRAGSGFHVRPVRRGEDGVLRVTHDVHLAE